MSCRHQKQRIVTQVCLTYKKLVLFVPISIFHSIKPRTLAMPSIYSPKFMTSALNISAATLGLPAANPAYLLTCSNPCAGFKFLLFKTTNTKTLKP